VRGRINLSMILRFNYDYELSLSKRPKLLRPALHFAINHIKKSPKRQIAECFLSVKHKLYLTNLYSIQAAWCEFKGDS